MAAPQPVEFTDIELVLEGLEQKTDAKLTTPGKLIRATNVEFDKHGELNKRAGYTAPPIGSDIMGAMADRVFHRVGTYKDELLIFAHDHVYAVTGVTLRGSCNVHWVATSSVGDGIE